MYQDRPEGFKSRGSSKGSSNRSDNAGTAAAAGGGVGSMLGNSGVQLHTGAVTTCPPNDPSLICTVTRVFTYIGWAILAIVILAILYYFAKSYMSKGSGRSSGGFFSGLFKKSK